MEELLEAVVYAVRAEATYGVNMDFIHSVFSYPVPGRITGYKYRDLVLQVGGVSNLRQ
jgi:hypothetical protein